MEKKVAEIFAGVGGFRLGLGDTWDTVWFNQWEPAEKKTQYAYGCYTYHYGNCLDKKGNNTNNVDIQKVNKEDIPDFNLLTGGFPCLTGDTLILTDTGYKELINIETGDMVLSHDGKFHKVVNFFDQGKREVFEIRSLGFDYLTLTGNHKLLVRVNDEKPVWMSVLDMMKHQNISLGIPINTPVEIADDTIDMYDRKSFYNTMFYLQNKYQAYIPNNDINGRYYLYVNNRLNGFIEDNYLWYPIVSICRKNEPENVYDIEVEDSHSYVANNCVSHNCQNYSVAATLSHSKGIEGDKGVLWWSIRDILEVKKPAFVLLENVDRLLKSPAKQRGRDFAIILTCFRDLGYTVEWRVINAADYGFPQRRKRVFIFASRNDTKYARTLSEDTYELLHKTGFFARAFPVSDDVISTFYTELFFDIGSVSSRFTFNFRNAGFMQHGIVITENLEVNYNGNHLKLGDVMDKSIADDKYFIPKEKLYFTDENIQHTDETNEKLPKEIRQTWQYIKGGKKFSRIAKNGHKYTYSEGPVPMIDEWDKPARTILTSEGSFSRTTHIVRDKVSKEIRLLTPTECEAIQGFPKNYTKYYVHDNKILIMPDNKRKFMMGNALVVDLIKVMEVVLNDIFSKEK